MKIAYCGTTMRGSCWRFHNICNCFGHNICTTYIVYYSIVLTLCAVNCIELNEPFLRWFSILFVLFFDKNHVKQIKYILNKKVFIKLAVTLLIHLFIATSSCVVISIICDTVLLSSVDIQKFYTWPNQGHFNIRTLNCHYVFHYCACPVNLFQKRLIFFSLSRRFKMKQL